VGRAFDVYFRGARGSRRLRAAPAHRVVAGTLGSATRARRDGPPAIAKRCRRSLKGDRADARVRLAAGNHLAKQLPAGAHVYLGDR